MAELRFWLLTIGTTVMIWIAADQQVTTTYELVVPFSLKPASREAFQVEVLDGPVAHITVVLRGPNRIIDGLKKMEPDLAIELVVSEHKSGQYTLDLAEEIRNQTDLFPSGLSVAAVAPAFLDVRVDQFVQRDVPLVVDEGDLKFEGKLQLDPTHAVVTISESQFSQLTNEQKVIVITVVQAFAQVPEGQAIQRTVAIPKKVGDVPAVRVDPSQVTLTGTVQARTRELELPTIPVWVAASPALLNRYVVKLEGQEGPTTLPIRVRGPLDVIDKLERDTRRIIALVQITSDEIQNMLKPGYSELPVFSGLPEGVTLVNDVERVSIELEPRQSP